jgi:dolichol-phosphate mannosyltransferase
MIGQAKSRVNSLPMSDAVRVAPREISIVIPVYNEGPNILATISTIKQKVRTSHRILIVYDFDEDNTLPVVQPLVKHGQVQLVKNYYGRGALAAIRSGFDAAPTELVLVMMADSSDDTNVVDRMADMIDQGYDLVCGSRYMRGGRQIGGPWFKKLLSRAAGVSLHYLVGLPTHDVTNSFKLYRKELLDAVRFESTGGFEIGMEIVVKAFLHGYRVGEVASVWTDRTAGESRFNLRKWLPKYLRWYWYAIRGRWLGIRPTGAMLLRTAHGPRLQPAEVRKAA